MTIAFEQEWELYHYSESLCSQKARLGLAEKGVDYKSHHIVICDVAEKCQNLKPDYLRVNPKGIVPTLVHKGTPVYDAHRIVKYVDEQCYDSGTRLWPEDEIRQQIAAHWFDEGMLDENGRYGSTFGLAIPILSHPILAQTLNRQPLELVEDKFRHHPLESRGKRFTALRRDGTAFPPNVTTTALGSICRGLQEINHLLDRFGGPYLLGEFALPDITMMACFHRLEDVRMTDLLYHEAVPLVGGYWQRLQERPSYRDAVIAWHDDVNWRSALIEIFGDKKSPRLREAFSIMDSVQRKGVYE